MMDVQAVDAARRGDLAAVRSLIEEQGKDVNEKRHVRICGCDIIEIKLRICHAFM